MHERTGIFEQAAGFPKGFRTRLPQKLTLTRAWSIGGHEWHWCHHRWPGDVPQEDEG